MGTNRIILIVASLFLIEGAAIAQTGDETVLTVTGNREVEPAYRQLSAPKIIDTNIATVTVDYPLLQLQYPTESEIGMIKPAAININPKLPKLYNSYVKLGLGTEFMPLGEFYYDSDRSRKFIYGAHVKHLSSFGNITGYAPAQFDRTGANIYGGINQRRYTLRGDVQYRNQGLHYYGFPDDTLFVADSIAQRYSDFGFGGSFTSHIKDSAKLNYTLGLNYNNFLSKKPTSADRKDWRARENFFGINTAWMYKHQSEVYNVDFDVLYNGFKYGTTGDTNLTALDSGLVSNNTIVKIHPTIVTRSKDNRFKAKVGMNLLFNSHYGTIRPHAYFDLEVKYSMFNDIFIPYAGITGGMTQNTFRHLAGQNEFIIPNLELRNENRPFDIFAGIKGTLSKRISFNVSGRFANVKDKALFVTDTVYAPGNAFRVVYDTMNIATLEGSISYQLSEKLKVDAIGRFNSYNPLNNSYAWNLPQTQVILRGSYNLFDKFLINLDLDLEQGRKALVYADGEGVTLENGQYIKDLGFIADANLGLEYRYNDRISAFIQFNNLAAQSYMRWYNSPVQQFQFMGGVTFRF